MAKTSEIPTGLQLFKLTGFDGDNTKKCSLTACEMDGNFLHLKSLAIDRENIEYNKETGEIILHSLGGSVIELPVRESIGEEFANAEVSFDDDGNVVITIAGETKTIAGFVTSENIEDYLEGFSLKALESVYHDNTLVGNGHANNPLKIEPTRISGMAPVVDGIINTVDYGDQLPLEPEYGETYVVKERYATTFKLYTRAEIEAIVALIGNGWRIPEKADFDGIFDFLECDEDRNHTSMEEGELGRYAGKALRSRDLWKEKKGEELTYWGNGIYGFDVYPSGQGDPDSVIKHVGDWCEFWTNTPDDEKSTKKNTSWYTKRFEHDRNGVYQTSRTGDEHNSLRLVKEIGINESFEPSISILGQSIRVATIPTTNGKPLLWTLCDIDFGGEDDKIGIRGKSSSKSVQTTAFFVKVWNGTGWDSRRLLEGETFINKEKEKNINGKNITHTLYVVKNGALKRVYEPIPVARVTEIWNSVFKKN